MRPITLGGFGFGTASPPLLGELVIWLGTLGLVVGFVLAALFLVPGPIVKMKGRR